MKSCMSDIRKILDAREERLNIITRKRKETSNLLICVKANICGNDKNIFEANIVLSRFINLIKLEFNAIFIEKFYSFDGEFYLVEIAEKDVIDVKRRLVNLENRKLGRYVDLDLFSDSPKSVTRGDLGLSKRRCIICGEDYNVCQREKRHTIEEIINSTKENIRSELVDELMVFTLESLREEVTAHPKFGLVTKVNSGKHKDMNYDTFIQSIDLLEPFLQKFCEAGFGFNGDTFNNVREIGKEAEAGLNTKIKGVNTYRGMIFLLGVLLPSIVNVIFSGEKFISIQHNIEKICINILKDFDDIDKKEVLTYGEKIYKAYGITGIRGVAKSGIDIGFKIASGFQLEDNRNDLVGNILLSSMAGLDDTVILHKGTLETLDYVKSKSKEIIMLGGYSTINGKKAVEEFTKECISLNISPGGSADITVVVLILLKIREAYF